MNRHFPFAGRLYVASCDVESLLYIKARELASIMGRRCIGIVCIQETRIPKTPRYVKEDYCMVILSGRSPEEKEWAGAGSIVAPQSVSDRFSAAIQSLGLFDGSGSWRTIGNDFCLCPTRRMSV